MSNSITVVLTAMTDPEEKYIAEAIASVLSQSVPVTELHVYVERDNSWIDRIIGEIPTGHPTRLHVKRIPKACLSSVRNTGVSNCTTQWVAFLDADDIWHEQKIQWQIEGIAKKPDAQFVGIDWIFVNDHNEPFYIGRCVFPIPSGWLVRREFLERVPFDSQVLINEDLEWLRRAFVESMFLRVAKVAVRYRVRPDSLFGGTGSAKPKIRQLHEALAAASYLPFVRYLTFAVSYLRYRGFKGLPYQSL